MINTNILNIAGYKFVSTPVVELPTLRAQLKQRASELNLKGTILLSTEGINAFLAGLAIDVAEFVRFLGGISYYSDINFKESESAEIPFTKLLVRVKPEIVTMGHEEIKPEVNTAPYISVETFKQWIDEEKDFVILDTRNNYEFALGSFDNAIDLNIESFREFPDAVMSLLPEMREKPIVTFCTGGIRCEKAAVLMRQKGFKEVYQLDGGILNYFEKVGGEYYQGDCFVFDKRVTVDSTLNPTTREACIQHSQIENANQLEQSIECPYCQHVRESRHAHEQAA